MKKIFIPVAISLFSLSVFLSSCKMGKEYQRPEIELPLNFGNTSFADTSSIADIAWNQFFTDTILLGLIQKGINYNHDLLMALKRIEIAGQQLKQARLLQLPELNLQVSGQYNRPSQNSLNGLSASSFLNKSHIENYLAIANLSWEADIWGKIKGQKEASLQSYLQTREAAKAVQTKLVADIARGYYNLRMLDRQLAIARSNLALHDSFLVATQLLKDAGTVSLLAVQQAASQKKTTALLLPALQQYIALQENALQVLTGQLPGSLVRTNAPDTVIRENLSAGLPIALLSRRPDVRATEMALMIANSKVGIARANMYPALNISAGGGFESFKASNWLNIPSSLFGLAAGTLVQPVFKKRALKTQYEIAKLEREEAVIRFRQSVLQASGEVANALVTAEKLKEQQELAIDQTTILAEAVQNAQLLFKSDMANYLEVLTAQSNALQAALNLASLQGDRMNAIVDLYRALGGGWK